MHESVATLTQLSDRDLWTSALSTNGERRKATALLLAHLAVIEARELHLLRGYSSMFDFRVRGLGMSEGTAHRAGRPWSERWTCASKSHSQPNWVPRSRSGKSSSQNPYWAAWGFTAATPRRRMRRRRNAWNWSM